MAARNGDKRGKGQTDPHRVIGYVRVSSDDQRLGPEAQRAALKQWCRAHGGTACADLHWWASDDRSARPSDGKPFNVRLATSDVRGPKS